MTQVWTLKQAIEKAASYCAAQERCSTDVRSKLFEWGLTPEDVEQAVAELIVQGFLNEERFAKAFARGKFHTRQWGRKKIAYELKRKNISQNCIRIALLEIDETEYLATIERLIEKKSKEIRTSEPFIRKKKLCGYLLSKGFEYELILKSID